MIEKTLRLHGPLNVSAPRISPGRFIAGQYIPQGTVVSTNPYSTARDPVAFPDPYQYMPGRWLSATAEMRCMNRPFSTGPRNCIGRHLANLGLILTLARIVQLFDLAPSASFNADSMRLKDRGVLDPWDEKLEINVHAAGSITS